MKTTLAVTPEQHVEIAQNIEDDHAQMVECLTKSGAQLLTEYTTTKAVLAHHAMGIAGEAGEIIDAIKKYTIYNKPFDRENIVEELGDLEFYMQGLRDELGITRKECLQANMTKLAKRYENFKYTDKAAQERKDKQ